MNLVIESGRLTKEPEIRTAGEMNIARYTLAVDRMKKDEADFINCISFGKAADFAEKYFHKGTKIMVMGRIQTGSYKNKDGQTVYTTDVVVDRTEFCESKNSSGAETYKPKTPSKADDGADDGFLPMGEDLDMDDLPWN